MDFPLTSAIASRVEVVAEAGSTNADLRAHAADPAWLDLSVLLTRNQVAGRGRLDRTWTAPDGAALAVSVLLRESLPAPAYRGWIPLAAGVALSAAIAAQLAGHEVGLKWPNDVLVDGHKISGILAEATAEAVIVGAGINTAMTAAQLPVPTATSFAVCGVAADEDRLLADYLGRLRVLLDALVREGEPAARRLHGEVTARCLSLGRGVRVVLPDDSVLEGIATRLDADGRLVVVTGGAEHIVAAGDVVHARLS